MPPGRGPRAGHDGNGVAFFVQLSCWQYTKIYILVRNIYYRISSWNVLLRAPRARPCPAYHTDAWFSERSSADASPARMPGGFCPRADRLARSALPSLKPPGRTRTHRRWLCRDMESAENRQPLPGDSRESPNIVPIDPTIWYTIRIVRAGSTFDEHCHGTVNHIEVDHAVPDLHGAHISTT